MSEAAGPRAPLVVNLDETSLAYHMSGLKGTVVKGSKARDGARLADVRGHVSYLASITHDVSVQPLLPQVLLGNVHKFTVKMLRTLQPDVPANVHLWRELTAWNTHATMRRYVTLLADSLGSLVQTRYVILLLDCAAVHFHPSIEKLAKEKGLRLVYVPTKMTSLLQPCDTHLFSIFKHALQENWRCRKSDAVGGVMDTVAWVTVILKTIQEVVAKKCWQHAFQADGILDQQSNLSKKLCEALGLKAIPCVGHSAPTAADVAHVVPSRARYDFLSCALWGFQVQEALAFKRRRLPDSFVRTFRGRPVATLD